MKRTPRPGESARQAAGVRAAVEAAEQKLRGAHPILRHQDQIAFAIQLGAVGGIVAATILTLAGDLPWWATIPVVAFLASLTHEIEHDLIHDIYYRGRPAMQNFLFALGWLTRPTTVSPWARRRMHLNHHRTSGTAADLEERAITNGERWGIRRLLMTGDNMLAIYLRPNTMRDAAERYIAAQYPVDEAETERLVHESQMSYVPLGLIAWGLWYAFLGFHGADAVASVLGTPIAWGDAVRTAMDVVDAMVVCLIAPNVLRTFCLHFISSNVHYYGDVEPGNVIEQTQVIDHPAFWPIQAFTANFGATHAIHHFVVSQPFYVRQLVAAEAHRAMRAAGVRFNDFGTFVRANRLHVAPQPA